VNRFKKWPKLTIILTNFVLLFLTLVILELSFGNWLSNNKMNQLYVPRDVKLTFSVSSLYTSEKEMISYSRDEFGLRGNFVNYSDIKILTIGGSTTDQRYIDDEQTWQRILQSELQNLDSSIYIANAGVDGQTTFGHIKNFDWWLNGIPDLQPKYVFFYVGINDMLLTEESDFDKLINESGNIIDIVKVNSVTYSIYDRLHQFFLSKYKPPYVNHNFTNLQNKEWTKNSIGIVPDEIVSMYVSGFLDRVEILIKKTKQFGSQPVFISQPTFTYHFQDDTLYGIKDSLKYGEYYINGIEYHEIAKSYYSELETLCENNSVSYIDIFNYTEWSVLDYYDYFHMTPKGTSKLAKVIFDLIKNRIE
jgi:lysophospholipase L1-like esterase